MQLDICQHNDLIALSREGIKFFITGRLSFEIVEEVNDIDLLIQSKDRQAVEKHLTKDTNKKCSSGNGYIGIAPYIPLTRVRCNSPAGTSSLATQQSVQPVQSVAKMIISKVKAKLTGNTAQMAQIQPMTQPSNAIFHNNISMVANECDVPPLPSRVFYKNKIDILYISCSEEWDEYDLFSRTENGIKYTHPAHSMLAKLDMIMSTTSNAARVTNNKHKSDIKKYLRQSLLVPWYTQE